MSDLGPAHLGHTFRFLFDIRGSSKVVGDGAYSDDRDFAGMPGRFEVRGWSLVEALQNAAQLPFGDLMAGGDDYEGTVRELLTFAIRTMHAHAPTTRDHAGGPHHYSDERLVDMLHELIREARDG